MTDDEGTPRRDRTPAAVAEDRGVDASGPPNDHDLQAMRSDHARSSLAAAVAEGRMAQADVDKVLERLARGEDAHRIRRELRRTGVLPRRAGRARR